MIQFKSGNILNEDVEALINTVNCVGVMGRGIALQFKKAYPDNFRSYVEACKHEQVRPGRMFVYETGTLTNPRYIINFPTKRHWRGGSRINDIETGLDDLVRIIRKRNIRSIAVPPLGSGLGGLDWNDVRPLIESKLGVVADLQADIYESTRASEDKPVTCNREVPELTSSRAALVGLIHNYLNGLLDPFITPLEIHKLMYFMQSAGQPLRLHFSKGAYGPYAENLHRVLNKIEGHFISGYADGEDGLGKKLKLIPGVVEDAQKILCNTDSTRERFNRVVNLVKKFESPYGLQLLSTVHWTLVHNTCNTMDKLVSEVHRWNKDKKRFTSRQTRLAIDVLHKQGWADSHLIS